MNRKIYLFVANNAMCALFTDALNYFALLAT